MDKKVTFINIVEYFNQRLVTFYYWVLLSSNIAKGRENKNLQEYPYWSTEECYQDRQRLQDHVHEGTSRLSENPFYWSTRWRKMLDERYDNK